VRVLVWPADGGASGFNRLRWPALALKTQGFDASVDTKGPRVIWGREWSGDYPPLDTPILGCDKPNADIVVIQRPGRAHWSYLIPMIQAHGVRVVVDVDDDFESIPRANKAFASYDAQRSPYHSSAWIARACELADLVTVTTPALAQRYGSHGRVAVLPNLVPESYLSVERKPLTVEGDVQPGVTVGWAGNVQTHPHDLETVGLGVARAVSVTGADLHIIGTGEGVEDRLHCPVDSSTGWVPFDRYPHEVARLDVGIVPLHDSVFNRAKSALKGAEYAALGVVPVMSATPDNQRLHGLGVGVLAGHAQQWKKHLVRLLDNGALRDEMAGTGREVMATQTYEGNCGRWADAWERALDREMATA
jgi:hypothetical protein